MRRLTIVVLILLPLCTLQSQNGITLNYANAPLSKVLQSIEDQAPYTFSFKSSNVEKERVSIDASMQEINAVLEEVFDQTLLEYAIVDSQFIVLTEKIKLAHHICGVVTDAKSGEPLPFAHITCPAANAGAMTAEDGSFSFSGEFYSNETFHVTYVGYEHLEMDFAEMRGDPCVRISMEVADYALSDVVITEYLVEGIEQAETGDKIMISPQRMTGVPGLVEADVLSVAQLLPGITSPTESASGLYIRGGTPDQNLVLWDGIPMYHTGHLFDMISAFNPNIIGDVEVYRGGMSAEYGGRVSGVINMQTDHTPPEKVSGSAGLNFMHGHANVETPLWKNAGLMISLRRSFTDFWETPTFRNYTEKVFQGTKLETDELDELNQTESSFAYGDMNFKLLWNPGKNKFAFNLFSTNNRLDYVGVRSAEQYFSRDLLDLTSYGSSLVWERDWSPKLSTEINITTSEYEHDYSLKYALTAFPDNALASIERQNNITDNGFKFTTHWRPTERHTVKFGYQYAEQRVELLLRDMAFQGPTNTPTDSTYWSKLHALYGEYSFNATDAVSVSTGLRYLHESTLGNDYFEPRISLNAHISDKLDLKATTSKQFQFISQLIILGFNDIGISNQIWIAANGSILPVIESNQWSAGLAYRTKDWTIDLEGYVKELVGVSTWSNGFGELRSQPFSNGNSRIKGIDVLVQRRFQNYRSWLSYTLSKADYEFTAIDLQPFPASHDQRHSLQWVHMYTPKNWEFSLGWQIRSGLPYSFPTGVGFAGQNMIPFLEFDEANGQRLATYHRLDLSAMYHFSEHDDSGIRGGCRHFIDQPLRSEEFSGTHLSAGRVYSGHSEVPDH